MMKIVINMLDFAYDHALRFDVVRNVAHLFVNVDNDIDLNTKKIHQSLNHINAIVYFDDFEIYIDESNLKLYNARTLSSKKSKNREFRFVSLQNDETSF